MLELFEIFIVIIAIIAWVIFLFFTIGSISNWEFKENAFIILTTLIISVGTTFGGWYINIQINIKNDLAGIKAYEQYKSEYPADKIIDTEIEQRYIKAIQELEYYKSMGLYKEEVRKEIPIERDKIDIGKRYLTDQEQSLIINDRLSKDDNYLNLNELINKYGEPGIVKGHAGKLYKEKFFEEVNPGVYQELLLD